MNIRFNDIDPEVEWTTVWINRYWFFFKPSNYDMYKIWKKNYRISYIWVPLHRKFQLKIIEYLSGSFQETLRYAHMLIDAKHAFDVSPVSPWYYPSSVAQPDLLAGAWPWRPYSVTIVAVSWRATIKDRVWYHASKEETKGAEREGRTDES